VKTTVSTDLSMKIVSRPQAIVKRIQPLDGRSMLTDTMEVVSLVIRALMHQNRDTEQRSEPISKTRRHDP